MCSMIVPSHVRLVRAIVASAHFPLLFLLDINNHILLLDLGQLGLEVSEFHRRILQVIFERGLDSLLGLVHGFIIDHAIEVFVDILENVRQLGLQNLALHRGMVGDGFGNLAGCYHERRTITSAGEMGCNIAIGARYGSLA